MAVFVSLFDKMYNEDQVGLFLSLLSRYSTSSLTRQALAEGKPCCLRPGSATWRSSTGSSSWRPFLCLATRLRWRLARARSSNDELALVMGYLLKLVTVMVILVRAWKTACPYHAAALPMQLLRYLATISLPRYHLATSLPSCYLATLLPVDCRSPKAS